MNNTKNIENTSSFRAFSSGPHILDVALESALPGLNGALQNAIDQHRLALAALNLNSISIHYNPKLPFPRTAQVVPPAPRLVGIETNPGPRGIRRSGIVRDALVAGIASAGTALGVAAAGGARRRTRVKKTNRPKKRAGRNVTRLLGLTPASDTTSFLPQPLSYAVPRSFYSSNLRNHVISLPFDCGSYQISSNIANTAFVFGSGSSTTTAFAWDPNYLAAGYFPFGDSIANLSDSFREFSITNLRVRYQPVVPVSTPGAFYLANIPDGAWPESGTQSTVALASFNGATVVQAGCPAEIPVLDMPRKWYFSKDANTITTPSEREEQPGVLAMAALAQPTTGNTTVGFIHVTGVIHLRGLGTMPSIEAKKARAIIERVEPPPATTYDARFNPAEAPVPNPDPPRAVQSASVSSPAGWFSVPRQ